MWRIKAMKPPWANKSKAAQESVGVGVMLYAINVASYIT